MKQADIDYFLARAEEADRLAAASVHQGVRATHKAFAATYRAHAGGATGEIVAPDDWIGSKPAALDNHSSHLM